MVMVSRYSLGHSQIRNLTASRGGSGCEEVRSLLGVVAFLHLLRHQPATNFWRPLGPLYFGVDPSRLHHFVRTTLINWDATVHLHLEVSSELFHTCFPGNLRIQKASIDVVNVKTLQSFSHSIQHLTANPDRHHGFPRKLLQLHSCRHRRHHLDHRASSRSSVVDSGCRFNPSKSNTRFTSDSLHSCLENEATILPS